jgi:glutamate racemase
VAQIQQLALAAAEFLIQHGAKLIVVACNTASVNARMEMRAAFPLPFVAVVPAVKPAAALTRTGRIGVVATEASARGAYLRALIQEHAQGLEVRAVGCPDLVRLAEAGVLEGPLVEESIRHSIQPMLDAGIDVLVLGCTHFPAQRAAFARVAGPDVAIIDSGAAIARQTRRLLERDDLLAPPASAARAVPRGLMPHDELWCSGEVVSFERSAAALLGEPVTARSAEGMLISPDAG